MYPLAGNDRMGVPDPGVWKGDANACDEEDLTGEKEESGRDVGIGDCVVLALLWAHAVLGVREGYGTLSTRLKCVERRGPQPRPPAPLTLTNTATTTTAQAATYAGALWNDEKLPSAVDHSPNALVRCGITWVSRWRSTSSSVSSPFVSPGGDGAAPPLMRRALARGDLDGDADRDGMSTALVARPSEALTRGLCPMRCVDGRRACTGDDPRLCRGDADARGDRAVAARGLVLDIAVPPGVVAPPLRCACTAATLRRASASASHLVADLIMRSSVSAPMLNAENKRLRFTWTLLAALSSGSASWCDRYGSVVLATLTGVARCDPEPLPTAVA